MTTPASPQIPLHTSPSIGEALEKRRGVARKQINEYARRVHRGETLIELDLSELAGAMLLVGEGQHDFDVRLQTLKRAVRARELVRMAERHTAAHVDADRNLKSHVENNKEALLRLEQLKESVAAAERDRASSLLAAEPERTFLEDPRYAELLAE